MVDVRGEAATNDPDGNREALLHMTIAEAKALLHVARKAQDTVIVSALSSEMRLRCRRAMFELRMAERRALPGLDFGQMLRALASSARHRALAARPAWTGGAYLLPGPDVDQLPHKLEGVETERFVVKCTGPAGGDVRWIATPDDRIARDWYVFPAE